MRKNLFKKGQHAIYKITSPSGRVYIGKTICMKTRMYFYKAPTSKSQPFLYHSLRKYRFDAHICEIKAVVYSKNTDLLNKLERFYIDFYKCNACRYKGENIGLNLTDGGEGVSGHKHTPDQIEANRLRNIGRPSAMKGKKLTEEAKEILRIKNTGENSPVKRLVINYETGIFYDTIVEAAYAYNINQNTLRTRLWNKHFINKINYA